MFEHTKTFTSDVSMAMGYSDNYIDESRLGEQGHACKVERHVAEVLKAKFVSWTVLYMSQSRNITEFLLLFLSLSGEYSKKELQRVMS